MDEKVLLLQVEWLGLAHFVTLSQADRCFGINIAWNIPCLEAVAMSLRKCLRNIELHFGFFLQNPCIFYWAVL